MASQHPPTQPASTPKPATSSSSPKTTVTATSVSTATGAVVGVILWALQTYVFPEGLPGALQAAIPIIIPAVFGFVVHLWATVNAKL